MTSPNSRDHVEHVRRYFDRRAPGYRTAFSRGVLGWVRARERSALFALLEARPGQSVLDAGSGPGLDAVLLRQRGLAVTAVDLSPRMVAELERAGVAARVADLEELDLGERFDRILCAGSLEFCAHPGRALERLALHLAPGGRMVVLYPRATGVGRAYWLHHRLRGLRVHLFSDAEMDAMLSRAGLVPGERARPTPFSAVISASR